MEIRALPSVFKFKNNRNKKLTEARVHMWEATHNININIYTHTHKGHEYDIEIAFIIGLRFWYGDNREMPVHKQA